MIGYLKKHWRGELSLPISYWLNSFLANIFAISIIFIINAYIEGTLKPFLILFALVFNYSLLIAIMVWQVTGTWRSAQNHKERTGRKGWAIAAQVMIIFGLIQSVKVFTDGAKQIIETAKVATGTDDFANFKVDIKNGTELHITGYIAFNLIGALEKYFKENPDLKSVHLESSGGRLLPARHIANLVVSKELTTYSDVGCLSACTMIFVAGKTRVVTVGTKLGFHAGAMPGVSEVDMKSQQKEDFDIYLSRGISHSFVQKAFNTPNNQMWYPTYRELMDAKVVTHVKVAKHFIPISRYCRKENCDKISTAPQWLQKASAETNLTLPRKLDEVTVLERTIIGHKNHFTYLYTILSKHADFDTIGKNIRKFACTREEMSVFVNNGITMHWKYRDQRGKTLHEVIVSPEDCNKYNKTPQ